MSTVPASGRRPPELDDPDWLRDRYARDGDMSIALDLGVSRKAVRLARERFGIRSRPRGGQYGVRGTAYGVAPRATAAELIVERISDEQRTAAPSLSLVAARVHSLHEANRVNDMPAVKDALISLASACGLVLDHLDLLEAA